MFTRNSIFGISLGFEVDSGFNHLKTHTHAPRIGTRPGFNFLLKTLTLDVSPNPQPTQTGPELELIMEL